MRRLKDVPVFKIILIVWLAFTSVYFVYGEYTRLKVFVAKASYTRGVQDSIGQLMVEAAKCQPIPVSNNGERVDLIALKCLNQPVENEEAVTE